MKRNIEAFCAERARSHESAQATAPGPTRDGKGCACFWIILSDGDGMSAISPA
jgi:hypothetical protein